jgi:transcriptional regulator NrdR family protein
MECPKCHGATSVSQSRIVNDGKRRRRECSQCHYKFTTIEVCVEDLDRYESVLRKIKTTTNMLSFVRDNCQIAINQLNKMEEEME